MKKKKEKRKKKKKKNKKENQGKDVCANLDGVYATTYKSSISQVHL
ncbi:hypothetical protein QG37_02411 [Candidozyma auris]|nr:hypothetical protein QG37_02411 [[Candida] auris]